MGAERQEDTPRHLNWWHQTIDYTGEGEGKEAGATGGLNSSTPLARSPPATPPLPPDACQRPLGGRGRRWSCWTRQSRRR